MHLWGATAFITSADEVKLSILSALSLPLKKKEIWTNRPSACCDGWHIMCMLVHDCGYSKEYAYELSHRLTL